MDAADEASDSNNASFLKRARANNNLKGVVPQQNGRWGAQIYANHQRIWLGTFKSEREAAMAYDSAAIKLRSRDSHRNFPTTHHMDEPNFQDRFSTDAVLNMIKDGSYSSKFSAFLRALEENGGKFSQRVIDGRGGQFSCSHLFQKELTPSDVGKLNRLVIPKKYAVKHFPYINESEEDQNGVGDGAVDDIELVFYDTSMRTWKFRYCYWKSSQSFVFTRGWNRFVKEKKLKAHDIITFYTYESGEERVENGQILHLIDVIYKKSEESCNSSWLPQRESDKDEIALQLKLGKILSFDKVGDDQKKECEINQVNYEDVGGKRIRLFGVHIN